MSTLAVWTTRQSVASVHKKTVSKQHGTKPEVPGVEKKECCREISPGFTSASRLILSGLSLPISSMDTMCGSASSTVKNSAWKSSKHQTVSSQ